MKGIKLMGVMLTTVCAMGLMATSVFALPDLSITLGETYPLHLNYESNTIKTKLENAGGGVLVGEGLHELSLFGELSAVGTFRAIFKKVETGTEKCFNQGVEANGEVLVEGESHIVYTSLAGSLQGLQLGVLALIKELTGATAITCPTNAISLKIRGSVIATTNQSGAGNTTQLIGTKGRLNGSLGKETFRAYYDSAGIALLARLELNVNGAGFKESNVVVEGEPGGTALEGKMFVISGR